MRLREERLEELIRGRASGDYYPTLFGVSEER